mgnify:CR=1 FL=1
MSGHAVNPRAGGTAGKQPPVPPSNQTRSAADDLPELSDVAVAGKILFQRSISLESADFDDEFDDCYGYADDFSVSDFSFGGGGGKHKKKSKNDNPNGVYSQRHIRQATARAASDKKVKPKAAAVVHHSKKKSHGKKGLKQ